MHTHRGFLCLPCMRGRRAVRRAFKYRANHWYNESDSTEDDERTASAFRIGHRAGTAVLPPCSTPQQLTEQQNKNTRRGTAGAFILVELTGVEPVSEKKAVRVSPGAVHLLNFPPCERVYTLVTLVASSIHDGLQSLGPCTFSTESTPWPCAVLRQAGRSRLIRQRRQQNNRCQFVLFGAFIVVHRHGPLLTPLSPRRNHYSPI